MSKLKFRGLVALELLILISVWVGLIITAHSSATPLDEVEPPQEAAAKITFIFMLIELAATIFQFTGLIGLLFLKGWARHLFSLSVALSAVTVLGFAGGSNPDASAIPSLLNVIYWLISGAILALCYTRLVWDSLQRPSGV